MQFNLHKDFTEISASVWNTLATRGISNTPFARHEYLSQWWKTRGGGEWSGTELILISASVAGVPIGIAPLFKAEHEGRNVLLLVGSIEISDYLDLIVQASDLSGFLAGLLDFLTQIPTLHGISLDLYNLPDASPTLPALKAEAVKRGAVYRQEVYRAAPHIKLEDSFESYLAGLEKKQRHEIRRKLRRAAEWGSDVDFHIIQQGSDLDPEIDAFFHLMAQDPDKARFLKPAMRDQMRSTIHSASEHGYLWLTFLSVGGIKAAAALNFDYSSKLWGYNSGINRDFMELSPGWVLLAHQIEWACKNGRKEFDFMRGNESYKYRFGAKDRHVVRVRFDPA